ncbi:di-trans,poly-cis-decaprenylcistransferase [Radiomyces spectabilis]|uniref:di-trans,poly-cis-decaprenylcistransferase n=1 Tax=Radiomyces spectabilis TaxID=64574 RepID=UPI00221E3EB6|nr:di-trans,poly-cis-decaprenylcistransferase [Radiomyces spectabilis]KAI8369412.1 di-trans,poly-cis-decaprenylcistransferase [Radiomyces spectabilis]
MLESIKTMTNHLYNQCCQYAEHASVAVLRKGRIPRHLGFILDGNRRYARKAGASSTKFGHYEGFKQLEKVLDICMRLGVETVTVYAFSIENFKRSADEVEYLMELFCEAFSGFCENNALVDEYEICIRFLGKVDYLPAHVAALARKVMEHTKHNKKRVFNICCPYTSRDEMATAIRENIQLVQHGQMAKEDLTEQTIADHLFTATCPPLDILIRTSGEVRLSDFLLWQASQGCHIQFVDCYWPEFSLWKLLPILLEYQIFHDSHAATTSQQDVQ